MSDYEKKFQRAIAEMESSGLRKSGKIAPCDRFLRRLGFEPIPEYYRTTLSRFAYDPLIYGGLAGFGMFLVADVPQDMVLRLVLYFGAVGYLVTVLFELSIRRARKRYSLSSWQDL